MPKVSKQFKKFASSGKLKETIQKRRQVQQIRRKADERDQRRSKQRGAPRVDGDEDEGQDGEGEDDGREMRKTGSGVVGGVGRTVEELFGEGGLDKGEEEEGSDLEDLSEGDDEDEEDEGEGEEGGEEDLLDEKAMKKAMKDLAKNDPDFYKYLEENDKELLEFGGGGKGKGKGKEVVDEEGDVEMGDEDEVEDEEDESDEEEVKKISVTLKMLRGWQEGMLKQNSIRSLRKTLIAFRAAAHMNEEDADQGSGRDTKYSIDSAQVFNKLVVTALKFTPKVLAHHLPFKTLPTGRIKLLTPKTPNQPLNRLLLSHFSTLIHLIRSLPTNPTADDADSILAVAVTESTKLLPWVMGARKHLRAYLKVLLELWTSAGDGVRIASFVAVRKMFVAGDDALRDLCLRNTYRSLLPSLRNTTPHTLPTLNLLKNSASTLFTLSPAQSYPHAFGFIRQLAVHLRNVVRSTTSGGGAGGGGGEVGEAFRGVYNWQFVHCLDFWGMVLGVDAEENGGAEGKGSELRPLIYPLVQIALGVVRLLPSSRYFPLRFQILSSLLRLTTRTKTYIPLPPFLLEILDSSEFRNNSNPKKTTLKPLDFEYIIRAPSSYPKTRVYQESLAEELVYLLAEYHAGLCTDIAFPELSLPVIVTLKRHLKKGSSGSVRCQGMVKVLIEKMEGNRVWVEGKRRNVGFAPRDRGEVERFCEGVKGETTPLGGWVKTLRKVREGKRREVEKSLRERQGVVDDEDDE